MSLTDYVIDILLVALVLRQVVARMLTARSVLFPLVLLAFAGSQYLTGFPTAGNDVLMDVVLVVVGAAFGAVSGMSTKVWRDESAGIWAKAGVIAASAWVLGMGIRLGFDIWAHTSSGEASLVRFSLRHSITAADAYSTAFVLMAFAQVVVRVGILQYRRIGLYEAAGSAPELA
ncbi:MAG: hypothetical protein ABSG36_02495 [Acidimicrobiales bacterium]|jgi:hypothetical protein